MIIRSTLPAFVLTTAILVLGCERANQPKRDAQPKEPASATQAVTAICLPCNGMKIEVKADTPRFDFGGKTYYFCRKECKEAFEKNPGKYIASASTTRPAAH